MSLYRRAARRDANEPEIVRALRSIGATVRCISAPGVPDLLVGFRGRTFLLETKTKRGHLTPKQSGFHLLWNGGPMAVVHSVDEALSVLGIGGRDAA